MYDSITATDIPTTAEMVAGYLAPSRFAWSAADWARFPNATKVQIAVRGSTNAGHVLDVETGDATPVQAVSWVVMRRKAGVDPTVYCNHATQPAVIRAFNAAGVTQPHYWIARYDGLATLPVGVVAKQYTDTPPGGGHFDLSVVADHWPGVDLAPPVPTPTPDVVDMNLTDKLSTSPAQGTVNEALNAVLNGVAGLRSAGPIANNVSNVATAVTKLAAQVAAIQGQLTEIVNALSALQPNVLTGSAEVSVTLNPPTVATATTSLFLDGEE